MGVEKKKAEAAKEKAEAEKKQAKVIQLQCEIEMAELEKKKKIVLGNANKDNVKQPKTGSKEQHGEEDVDEDEDEDSEEEPEDGGTEGGTNAYDTDSDNEDEPIFPKQESGQSKDDSSEEEEDNDSSEFSEEDSASSITRRLHRNMTMYSTLASKRAEAAKREKELKEKMARKQAEEAAKEAIRKEREAKKAALEESRNIKREQRKKELEDKKAENERVKRVKTDFHTLCVGKLLSGLYNDRGGKQERDGMASYTLARYWEIYSSISQAELELKAQCPDRIYLDGFSAGGGLGKFVKWRFPKGVISDRSGKARYVKLYWAGLKQELDALGMYHADARVPR